MFKNLFKSKILDIQGEKIKLRHGFYDIEDMQMNIDTLIVTAKLMGYEVKTFWAAKKTGFFIIIFGESGHCEFNFFTGGERKRTYSVHIEFGYDIYKGDDQIFHVGNQYCINKKMQEILKWL